MRKLIPLFVVLVLLSGYVSIVHDGTAKTGVSQRRDVIDSLEAFSRFIFECVQKNDLKAYSKRVPTKEQLYKLIEIAKKTDSIRFRISPAELDEKIKEQSEKIQPSFTKVYEDGLKKGIDWKKAVYTRTVYEISNEPGFVGARIKIYFAWAGKTYILRLRDMLKIGKRWYSYSKMSLEDQEDWDYEGEYADSVMVDSMPYSPDVVMDTVVAVDSLYRH